MTGPIVVIGAARSGTKFLRDVLAAGRGTAAVPYDVNYVWRYGAETAPHDRLDPDDLSEEQARFIARTLPKIAGLRGGEILIEKTVSNTLRTPYVAAVLPNARFVHLVRNGRDVAESAMGQWRAAPDRRALLAKLRNLPLANFGYALWFAKNMLSGLASGRRGGKIWGPRYPGIADDVERLTLAEVCALQWKHSVETARADLARLEPQHVVEVRYEDLVARPEVLDGLLDRLAIPDPDASRSFYRATVRNGGADRFEALPTPDRVAIDRQIAPTLAELGYRAS